MLCVRAAIGIRLDGIQFINMHRNTQ